MCIIPYAVKNIKICIKNAYMNLPWLAFFHYILFSVYVGDRYISFWSENYLHLSTTRETVDDSWHPSQRGASLPAINHPWVNFVRPILNITSTCLLGRTLVSQLPVSHLISRNLLLCFQCFSVSETRLHVSVWERGVLQRLGPITCLVIPIDTKMHREPTQFNSYVLTSLLTKTCRTLSSLLHVD